MTTGPREPSGMAAAKVFITYRREETAAHAGRLYDAMVARFGERNVFMDVDMAPGVDFVERITEAVAACHVLIVVMGPRWATVEDEQGAARIANPEDFVRLEVETALRRPDVTPIPVLVSGARMPKREDLPPEVRPITRRNAIELSDQRWRYDVGRLISALDELLAETPLVPAEREVPAGDAAPVDAAHAPVQTAPKNVAAPTSVETKPASGLRRPRWALLGAIAIAAIVAAVVIAASGSGGNEDEDQIASVIETESTTTDPADCTKLHTQRFLDQVGFDGTGQEAIKACSQDTLNTADKPDSVDVTDVHVSGNRATAEALYNGGLFDGQSVVFSLRKDIDQWKLDHIDDIKDFDLQRFADAFAETAPKFTNPLAQKQASCAARQFNSMSPNEVKAGILSGDPQQLLPFHQRCGIDL